jgi:hypothetical protein
MFQCSNDETKTNLTPGLRYSEDPDPARQGFDSQCLCFVIRISSFVIHSNFEFRHSNFPHIMQAMPISPFVANLRKKIGTDTLFLPGINAIVLNDCAERSPGDAHGACQGD